MDELQQAQQTLARALGKARAGEDRELAQRVREKGEGMAQMLAGLLKMTRVHAADNRAFEAPIAEFVRSLAELEDLVGVVNLVAVDDQAFLNEVRLRSEGRPGLSDLGPELRKHNVGGITFHAPLEERQARLLVAAFAAPAEEPHPRTALRARLDRAGVGPLDLQGIFRFRTSEDPETGRVDALGALDHALRASAEGWAALAAGRVLNPLPLRRAVALILEAGPRSPDLWEAWVTGRAREDHAVTVALHALLLGEAAGLPRAALQDLGVAALVHDVGYAAMGGGEELAGSTGLARHPGEGARALLRQRGFSEAKLRRLRAVLDHHRSHGEPRGGPSPSGSVLRIAEDYAGLLRVCGQQIAAADALGAMSQAAGTQYHPILMRLMVNALGAHPPGTLLELADGRRARSVSPARGRALFALPLARLLDPATGAATGERLDLASGPAVRRARPG